MFSNIGSKIKGFVMVIFTIEVVMACMFALVKLEDTMGFSLIIAGIMVLVAWISSWLLYGFGEIIDKLTDIERNTRFAMGNPGLQTRANYERADKIEKLRAEGLISEQDYQQAITRK